MRVRVWCWGSVQSQECGAAARCGSVVRRHLARARRLGECSIAAPVVRVRLDVLHSMCIACE